MGQILLPGHDERTRCLTGNFSSQYWQRQQIMSVSHSIPEQQGLHLYIPLSGREITRIRRGSLLKSFGSFLGALLPVLALCVVAVLVPMVFGQPLWHSALLLVAMVLVGDMILGRRKIGWLRRNVTMMLTGAAGYFVTMPWHREVLPANWSAVDVGDGGDFFPDLWCPVSDCGATAGVCRYSVCATRVSV